MERMQSRPSQIAIALGTLTAHDLSDPLAPTPNCLTSKAPRCIDIELPKISRRRRLANRGCDEG